MLPHLADENLMWDGFESLPKSIASPQAVKSVGERSKICSACLSFMSPCLSIIQSFFLWEFIGFLTICSRIFLLIAHIWTFLWTMMQKKKKERGNWTHFLAFSVSSSKFPLLVRGWMLPSSHVYQGTFSFSRPDKSIHSYPYLLPGGNLVHRQRTSVYEVTKKRVPKRRKSSFDERCDKTLYRSLQRLRTVDLISPQVKRTAIKVPFILL